LEKFGKGTEALDEILSKQRSPSDKTRLDYTGSPKTTSSSQENTQTPKINCDEHMQGHNTSSWNKRFGLIEYEAPRSPVLPRYGNIFLVIILLAKTLDTKQLTVNSMQETTI